MGRRIGTARPTTPASLAWVASASAQTREPQLAASAQAKELIVAGWGGKFKAGWDKSLIPEFEAKYGVKVVWLIGQNSAGTLARIVAQKANPSFDVALLDVGPHAQAARLALLKASISPDFPITSICTNKLSSQTTSELASQ